MNRCRYECPPCSPTRYTRHVSGTWRRPMSFSHLGPVSSLSGPPKPPNPSTRNLTLKKPCGEAGGAGPRAPAGAGPQARGRACQPRQHSSWQGVTRTWRRKDKTLRTLWQWHGPRAWPKQGYAPFDTSPRHPNKRGEHICASAAYGATSRTLVARQPSDPHDGDSCGHAAMPQRPSVPRCRRAPRRGAQLPKSTYSQVAGSDSAHQ